MCGSFLCAIYKFSFKFVTNNSNYIRCLFYVAMLLMPAKIKPKSFESTQNFFFTNVSCLRACLGARLLPQSYQYPSLLEGTDRIGGQLHRDKECPFQWCNYIWQSLEEGAGK